MAVATKSRRGRCCMNFIMTWGVIIEREAIFMNTCFNWVVKIPDVRRYVSPFSIPCRFQTVFVVIHKNKTTLPPQQVVRWSLITFVAVQRIGATEVASKGVIAGSMHD